MSRHRKDAANTYTVPVSQVRQKAPKDLDPDATVVSRANLTTVAARPPIVQYLGELWERRHFIVFDARSKAFKSSRNMILGRAWLIIQPLLDIMIYALIFGIVLKTSRGIDNFLGYLTIGVVFFKFFSSGISSGSNLIQSSRGLISSFSFPKAALPIATTIRQFIDNLIPAIVAVILAFLFQFPSGPSWHVVLIVPLYVLLHLMILGCEFIVARATAFIPDLRAIVGVLTRALFFTSGVFFSIDRFDSSPTAAAIMNNNPGYIFLQACRDVTIYNTLPSLSIWVHLLCWTLGLTIFGFIYFWFAEERYAGVQ
ncbi:MULTISPECIES: ABC transporter permease [Corynebacterium]|uniref:Transport permease protein n=1 Tax=Corynebacterium hadale TaxID=2026255 RepID=A0A269PFQ7_9CORY|nr:ABC transporter permease [Corynebacterium hadale]PAJ71065.1 ABC transporter permease [Corynebacterium hadale]WKC60653.1 Teichoic acid translocation permease protein TagG [Corynebacterium hadale]